jgi:hypothetical protein
MKAFFDRTPDAGLAGCTILNPDGSFQLPCRRSFPTPWVAFTKVSGLSTLFPRARAFGRYNLTYLDPAKTYRVDAVSGSFMMVRRSVVETVGGLDESYFMYGEDLDWCFRIGQAGFGVYYVHETSIIHFKGESTRRSNIDELRHFYGAMGLFVEKHYAHSAATRLLLKAGILLRGAAASIARVLPPVATALTDAISLNLALFLSAYWYFGSATHFTFNAHPLVWVVPALILGIVASMMGLYTNHRRSVTRSGLAVLVAYVFISALVFFARNFAYSRIVVLLSGFLTLLFIPGWRLGAVLVGWRRQGRGGRIFGSRTLVVGTGPQAGEIVRKLRGNVITGYAVVGLVDTTRKRLGEHVEGVEIVGSIGNIARVVEDLRVTDVIFAMGDGLAYADMLDVVARSESPGVNYRLVPTGQDAILGKTRVDDLAALPLVDLEVNLHRPLNRAGKRLFDLFLALPLLLLLYLPVRLFAPRSPAKRGNFALFVLSLPRICMGTMSFVGYPAGEGEMGFSAIPPASLGKPGLTGILQINAHADLRPEERERYLLSYARNHSLGLDLEILLKALLGRRRNP